MDARVRVLGEDVLEWSHDDFAPFSLADAPDALDVHDHQAELVVVHGPAAIARAAPGWADGDEDDDDEDVWADDRRAASEEAAQSPPARGVKRSLEMPEEASSAPPTLPVPVVDAPVLAPLYALPKRRISLKPTKEPEPRGAEQEKRELHDLNERWKNLSDAEKQIAHRTRLKWIAGRLAKRFGTGPTITSMLRHIGYPLGRRLTISQLEAQLAEARSNSNDWTTALSGFMRSHLSEKGKHRTSPVRSRADDAPQQPPQPKPARTGFQFYCEEQKSLKASKSFKREWDRLEDKSRYEAMAAADAVRARDELAAFMQVDAADLDQMSERSAAAKRRAAAGDPRPAPERMVRVEPKTEEEERAELEDLNLRWRHMTVSERAASHYTRLKWVSARLSAAFAGQGPSAALLQPIRKSVGLALTLTQLVQALSSERRRGLDWKQCVAAFLRAHDASNAQNDSSPSGGPPSSPTPPLPPTGGTSLLPSSRRSLDATDFFELPLAQSTDGGEVQFNLSDDEYGF